MLAICLKNGKKEEQVETFEPNAEGVTINSIIEKMQKLFNSIANGLNPILKMKNGKLKTIRIFNANGRKKVYIAEVKN